MAIKPGEVERVDKALVDSAIAELDRRMSDQLNAILHHEDFQKLEASWRGLKFLVDRTEFRRNIKLEILNVSKEDLAADFEDVPEPIQSGLFKHVYVQEYDQPGGQPIGAIIGNYEFENRPPDLGLLRNLSKIAAACHAPFIGGVGAAVLRQEDRGDPPPARHGADLRPGRVHLLALVPRIGGLPLRRPDLPALPAAPPLRTEDGAGQELPLRGGGRRREPPQLSVGQRDLRLRLHA